MNFISSDRQRNWFLVFAKGDDVLATLGRFARENGIEGARFDAIGALRRAVIAWWNPDSHEYEHIAVEEQVEVASLSGDIAIDGAETKVHAHIVLGRKDGSALAGHLLEGTVFPTLEMHVVDLGTRIERRRDDETGLSLIALGEKG